MKMVDRKISPAGLQSTNHQCMPFWLFVLEEDGYNLEQAKKIKQC